MFLLWTLAAIIGLLCSYTHHFLFLVYARLDIACYSTTTLITQEYSLTPRLFKSAPPLFPPPLRAKIHASQLYLSAPTRKYLVLL